ncbi:MAG: DNA primase [FCB group bacterium]|nr:DNA primase [FCB group bacterium]
MIPQETIEQIRLSTDIVQLISEYISLKKRGKNYVALCPFHTEKTPSFNVSSEKQIYHCFGCGKGGNVFTFLIEHEKMSFIEAVRFLAKRANIPIQEEKQSEYRRELLDRLNYANQTALEYFQKTLKLSKYQTVLNNYLKSKRHINNDSIDFFKIGLAGEEWEGLINYAAKKDITVEDLEKAGLVTYSDKSKKFHDLFYRRLMFPIFNLSQKAIAFGGRTLKKGMTPKYINSPETPLYIKSNILFGLNFAKDEIRTAKSVFIVEGYFDVISLWQIGIKNVVASSGTAFTSPQARLLARFADEVFLFFDADSAGRKAALRSVDALYDAGLEVKIIVPPEGEDPDSIAHKFGRDKIEQLQENAIGFIPYRVKDFNQQKAGIIDKEKLIKELNVIGSKITDPTRRSLFFSEAANLIGVDMHIFQQQTTSAATPDKYTNSLRKRHNAVEAGFLSILFNNPGSLDTIFEKISPDDFDSKSLSRIYSAMMNQYRTSGVIDARHLIDNAQDNDFVSLVTEIASTEWEADKIEPETRRFVNMIVEEKLKRIRNKLQKELAEAEKAGDQKKADQILQEIKSYGLNAKKN